MNDKDSLDRVLEALRSQRLEDLDAEDQALAHSLSQDPARRLEVAQDRVFTNELEAWLQDVPAPNIDVLVGRAMEHSPMLESSAVLKPALAASVMTLLAGGIWLRNTSVPSVSEVSSLLHGVGTLSSATQGLLAMLGGSSFVAFGLGIFMLLTALPMRMMSRRFGSATLLLLGASFCIPTQASAYTPAGPWPETDKTVTVHLDDVSRTQAMSEIARSAELGVSVNFPEAHADKLSLHAEGLPLVDVLAAVYPEDTVTITRKGAMLIVSETSTDSDADADADADAETPSDADDGFNWEVNAGERVSFGSNVLVRKDEVVTDVATFGGNAKVHGNVTGDVVTMGGNATLHGAVRGAVVSMGGNVFVHGLVMGDVLSMGGNIHVEPGGKILGDIIPFGGAVTGAKATKHKKHQPPHSDEDDDEDEEGFISSFFGSLTRFGMLFLLGLLLMSFSGGRMRLVHQAMKRSPGRSVVVGGLTFIASAVAMILLALTVVGIVGTVLWGLALGAALYAGLAIFAFMVGESVPVNALKGHPVRQLAVGVLILFLCSLVPIASSISMALAACIGVGAVVLTRAGTRTL